PPARPHPVRRHRLRDARVSDDASPGDIEAIEALAVDLARSAGAEVERALRREVRVAYKPDAKGRPAEVDPVSEVDEAVERLVRDRLAARYPDHAIIGEESEVQPDGDAEWAW